MASREGPHVRPATRRVRRLPPVALRRVLLIVLSAVVALLAVNACSSAAKSGTADRGTTGSTAVAPAGTATATSPSAQAMIHIENFHYRTPASVSPGAAVQVMNMDNEAHTVTSDAAGGFQLTVPAGTTVTLTAPTKPGRYPFHCDFHANMHGVLVVG